MKYTIEFYEKANGDSAKRPRKPLAGKSRKLFLHATIILAERSLSHHENLE